MVGGAGSPRAAGWHLQDTLLGTVSKFTVCRHSSGGTQRTRPAQQGQGSAGAAPPWLVGTCLPEQGDRLGRAGLPVRRWRGPAGRGFPPREEELGRLLLEPGWLQLQTQVCAGSPRAEGPKGGGQAA